MPDCLPITPRPLTRQSSSGELYQRLPEVEAQINEMLRAAPDEVIERLRNAGEDSPQYLKEETLVYLIREYFTRPEQHVFEELASALTRRCQRHIARHARRFVDQASLDDCAGEILSNAFEQILDFDSDRGDYIQVRFWHYLKRLESDITQKYNRSQKKDRLTDSYDHGDDPAGESKRVPDNSLSPEERLLLRRRAGFRSRSSPNSSSGCSFSHPSRAKRSTPYRAPSGGPPKASPPTCNLAPVSRPARAINPKRPPNCRRNKIFARRSNRIEPSANHTRKNGSRSPPPAPTSRPVYLRESLETNQRRGAAALRGNYRLAWRRHRRLDGRPGPPARRGTFGARGGRERSSPRAGCRR